jgi:hypothetical protein
LRLFLNQELIFSSSQEAGSTSVVKCIGFSHKFRSVRAE